MPLLDTNVLSEVVKKAPNPNVIRRLREADPGALFASALSVMEMRFGCVRAGKGEGFWQKIVNLVLSRVRILPLTAEDALLAGDLLARLAVAGVPLVLEDVLIASTALRNDLVVVSRNEKHFARIPGLRVENWFHP